MSRSGPDDHGLLPSLRRVAATLADMAQSRLELASIEVGETVERLITSIVVAFAAVLLLAAALVALSAMLVLAVDESRRLLALGVMGGVYLAAGLWLLARLRARLRDTPPLLSGTLSELRNDTRVLRGASQGDRTA